MTKDLETKLQNSAILADANRRLCNNKIQANSVDDNKIQANLTEQWEKGKLTGEYWCEITESPYPERVYLPTCDGDIIVKVLAPVPSYKEYQILLSDQLAKIKGEEINAELEAEVKEKETQRIELMMKLNDVNNENHALGIEIKQLKTLLKECVPYVNHRCIETRELLTKPYTASDKVLHKKAEKLLTKIDEVLQ